MHFEQVSRAGVLRRGGARWVLALGLAGAWWGAPVATAQLSALHSFPTVADASAHPGTLTLMGASLYGMTEFGGANNTGTVFKIDTNGANFSLLHTFNGTDGAMPSGLLTAQGPVLYGATAYGGGHSGTVFKLKADGSAFATLHVFNGGSNDGAKPCVYGGVILSGAQLYGATAAGGANNLGTLFRLSTNSDVFGYTLLHHFSGGAADGAKPWGQLVLAGGILYGTSTEGGSHNGGAVFKIDTNGAGLAVLHSFGGVGDGAFPAGGLTLSGGTLYGFTAKGGVSNGGTVFKLGTNGTGYSVLRQITSAADGFEPLGPPVVKGPIIYGYAPLGGVSNAGTAFLLNTNGTGFTVLRNFSGLTDGGLPFTSPTLVGSTLYGSTLSGGAGGGGVVFQLPATVSQYYFQNAAGSVVGWVLDAAGHYQASRLLGAAGVWRLKTVGDLNGDGLGELLFQAPNGDLAVWYVYADGSLRSSAALGPAGLWEVKALADYTGDGQGDILFQNAAGAVAMWQVTAAGVVTNAALLAAPSEWRLKAAIDLDGDHKAELFWQNAAGVEAIWFHNPNGSIRAYLGSNMSGWELCGSMDLDGDGIGDLAWQAPNGTVACWFMNADGTARAAAVPGNAAGWKLKAAGR